MQVLPHVPPILSAFLFVLPLGAQEIAPADSAKPETIERFFVASRVEQVFASSRELMFGSVPAPEPIAGRWRELMAKYLPYDSVKVDLFRIYREAISETDMQGLIRFYESDLGQRVMVKLPSLLNRASGIVADRLRRHLPEFMAEMRAGARDSP